MDTNTIFTLLETIVSKATIDYFNIYEEWSDV